MDPYETLEIYGRNSRKTCLEKQNRLIQKKSKTPETSSIFSYDMGLNLRPLKTEYEDAKEGWSRNYSSDLKIPSEIFYECVNSNFSEKDQKILRLMAFRREAKIKEDEIALAVKKIWEEERKMREKKSEKNKKSALRYLTKKKEWEDFEKLIRKSNREEALKKEKAALEMKIREKHEKAKKKQKTILTAKKLSPEILNTKLQVLFHQEVKKQIEKEKEVNKLLLMQVIKCKEKRSQEKLQWICMEKNQKIKEESHKRELKLQAAKNYREELNRQFEEDNIQKLSHFQKIQSLREERIHWETELKKKNLLDKNEKKKQKHALIYSKLKEEELDRINQKKSQIQAKNLKIKYMEQKRESAILKSRQNARMSACLRQKMRSTYDL